VRGGFTGDDAAEAVNLAVRAFKPALPGPEPEHAHGNGGCSDGGDGNRPRDEEAGGRDAAATQRRPWCVVHAASWGEGGGRGGLPPALLWLQRALLQGPA
jgi:hypothetical protein